MASNNNAAPVKDQRFQKVHNDPVCREQLQRVVVIDEELRD